MSTVTFAQAAKAVETLCGLVTRGGEHTHGFAVMSVSKLAASGKRTPTAEAEIVTRKTGLNLTDPATLAAIVQASDGRLYSDGLKVWDAVAEAKRKATRDAYSKTKKTTTDAYRAAKKTKG